MRSYKNKTEWVLLSKKSKIIFEAEKIKSEMTLEEIVAVIATGDRNSPEYGLTLMILKSLVTGNRSISKNEMYDMFMRNREHISKASFYRILNRLIDRGMVVFDEERQIYAPSVIFSNSLQKLAIAWESLALWL